jgi:PAS domain S-box-containing protein
VTIAVAYFVGAQIGFALTPQSQPISTFWPPNAIVFGALLLAPPRMWGWLILAVLPAHLAIELTSGVPLAMALSWFVSNCFEALVGATAVRSLARGKPLFTSLRGVTIFVAAGAVLAPFVSSFADAFFVQLNQYATAGFWATWRERFFANVLADLTLVPAIVIWGRRGLASLRESWRRRKLEILSLSVLTTVVGVIVSTFPWLIAGERHAMLYAPLPLLLWATLRFGPPGTSACLVASTIFSIWGVIDGNGPFTGPTLREDVFSLQLFLTMLSITLLALAAVLRERELAEAALRDEAALVESESRLRELADTMPQVVFSARPDGRMDYFNERWYELTRTVRGPIEDSTWLRQIHPRDVDGWVSQWRASVEAGRSHEHEVRFRCARSGTYRWHLVRALPVRGTDGQILRWYGTATDIDDHKRNEEALRVGEAALRALGAELEQRVAERTVELSLANATLRAEIDDRLRAEQALRALERQLAHLGRVAVLGELSAALAHEVNQPLTAILANARAAERLLARGPASLPEVHAILADIIADDLRAGAVIRRVRALIQKGEVDTQPVMPNEVITEVLGLAHSDLMLREVHVRTELAESLPLVPADRVQLQQVLLNLIVNACDAMSPLPSEERVLTITTEERDGEVHIAISDRGIGIPDDTFDSVFEPFVTTKENGLGLGLAICRSIVHAHRGRLWVIRNADRGVTFHLALPHETSPESVRANHSLRHSFPLHA